MLNSYLTDESLYIAVLIYTLLSTFVIKNISIDVAHRKKQLYCIFGIVLIFLITGPIGLLWSLIYPLVTILSLVLIPKRLSLKVFITFYILTSLYIKINNISSFNRLINVLLMISSLKCIAIINDIQNDNVKFSVDGKSFNKLPLRQCKATTTDIIYYVYCYCGLFTGPFFTYRTYYDMVYSVDGIYADNVPENLTTKSKNKYTRSVAWRSICMEKICWGIVLAMFYYVLNGLNLKHKLLNHLYDHDNQLIRSGSKIFLWKTFYLSLFMYLVKCRFIACWFFIESVYIALGLGAYPSALLPQITTPPKRQQSEVSLDELYNSEISYVTIKGSDIYKMDFSIEMLDVINSWNATVNYFMSHYVGGNFRGLLKAPMSLLFSAFWHGIHPNYYICFYTIILGAYAQKYFKDAFTDWLPPYYRCYKMADLLKMAVSKKSLTIFVGTIVAWFINIRMIEYSSLPFFLLDSMDDLINVWKDVYFWFHIFIAFLFLSGFIKKQFPNKKIK